MKIYLICAILYTTYGVSYAQRLVHKNCPSNVEVITNFELPRYLGLWYELSRYEQTFQKDGECVQAQYSLNVDGSVHVYNSMTKPPSQEREFAVGRAVFSYPGVLPAEAKLNVTFGEMPATTSNYWVIDTDYDNYSLVWSCQNVESNMSTESAWLLSRTPKLNEVVEELVNEAVLKYFTTSDLRVTNQDAELCQY